jgi:hypothetical protein
MSKFMILGRATSASESGTLPPTEVMMNMLKYNNTLLEAGVLIAGDGFLPSSKAARISFDSSNNSTVTNGPFDKSTIFSGFWLIKAKDLQEAIQWAQKAPIKDGEAVLEVRQVASAEDFGDKLPEEFRAGEAALRKKLYGGSN